MGDKAHAQADLKVRIGRLTLREEAVVRERDGSTARRAVLERTALQDTGTISLRVGGRAIVGRVSSGAHRTVPAPETSAREARARAWLYVFGKLTVVERDWVCQRTLPEAR